MLLHGFPRCSKKPVVTFWFTQNNKVIPNYATTEVTSSKQNTAYASYDKPDER